MVYLVYAIRKKSSVKFFGEKNFPKIFGTIFGVFWGSSLPRGGVTPPRVKTDVKSIELVKMKRLAPQTSKSVDNFLN